MLQFTTAKGGIHTATRIHSKNNTETQKTQIAFFSPCSSHSHACSLIATTPLHPNHTPYHSLHPHHQLSHHPPTTKIPKLKKQTQQRGRGTETEKKRSSTTTAPPPRPPSLHSSSPLAVAPSPSATAPPAPAARPRPLRPPPAPVHPRCPATPPRAPSLLSLWFASSPSPPF